MTSLSGLVHVTSLSAVTLWEVGNVVLDLLTCHKSLGLEKKENSVYIKVDEHTQLKEISTPMQFQVEKLR